MSALKETEIANLRVFAATGGWTTGVDGAVDDDLHGLSRRGLLTRNYVGLSNDKVRYELTDAGQAALDAIDEVSP